MLTLRRNHPRCLYRRWKKSGNLLFDILTSIKSSVEIIKSQFNSWRSFFYHHRSASLSACFFCVCLPPSACWEMRWWRAWWVYWEFVSFFYCFVSFSFFFFFCCNPCGCFWEKFECSWVWVFGGRWWRISCVFTEGMASSETLSLSIRHEDEVQYKQTCLTFEQSPKRKKVIMGTGLMGSTLCFDQCFQINSRDWS